MMWWTGSGPFPWGWMLLGWLWMLLFWGAIIALVIWVVRSLTRPRDGVSRSALDIAKERYARGELTREQFDQLKRDLM